MNLEDLLAVVRRGGVEPTPLELAETLWLAAQMGPATADRAPPADAPRPRPRPHAPPPAPESRPSRPPRPEAAIPPPPILDPPPPLELHPYLQPTGTARAAALEEVPKPAALDDRLAFQRALHPLLRRVPVAGLGALDEEATARLAAEHPFGARWPAVMRPAARLWLDAVVVVDMGDSMVIWQDLATDIITVLRESGVFRQVSRYRLDDHAGTARLADWQDRPVAPRSLVDPGQRRVILVVSDCVGRMWRSGTAGAVLHEWVRRGPVAILQPLPERLWARTGAPTVAGTVTAPRPGAPNSDLNFSAFGGRSTPEGAVVPVLEISSAWLSRWSTLVAGGPPITAAVTGVTGDAPAQPAVRSGPPPTADQRVRAFRAVASSEAFELARYVAFGEQPVLEVIRYVHHAMFRPAKPAHLAEVLLSGLLSVVDSQRGRYRFVDGVRKVLLESLTVSETLYASRLLEGVSASVRRHLPSGRSRFPVLTPGDGDERLDTESVPFAIAALGARRISLAKNRRRQPGTPPATEVRGTPPSARPQPPNEPLPQPPAALDLTELLDPRSSVLTFRGRDRELASLQHWCTGSGISLLLLTGPPGAGKSRLAYDFARRQRVAGWAVINASRPLPPGDDPVLIVADRADLYPEQTFLSLPEPAGRTIRVLITARAAGEWWRGLRKILPDALLRTSHTLELATFARSADHTPFAREMVLELGRLIYPQGSAAIERARQAIPDPAGDETTSPLDLCLLALQGLLGRGSAPAVDYLLARERRYAEETAIHTEITFGTAERLDTYLAAAQLYGAGSVAEAHEVVRRAGVTEGTDPETVRRIAAWLYRLYPGVTGQRYWSALPRAVRELLVVPAVLRDPQLIAILPEVATSQARRALNLLVPVARQRPGLMRAIWSATGHQPALYTMVFDQADRAGGISPELLDLARVAMADPAAPVTVLRAVADGITQTALLFDGQDAGMADALVTSFERLAAVSAPHRSAQAEAVRERGLIWERDGHGDLALRSSEREIDLRRRLIGPSSAPGTSALAHALTTYADRLDRDGKPVHGLAAINEALQLLERLGAEPAITSAQAYALVHKARLLGKLDRIDEAAEAAREATTHYRRLETIDDQYRVATAHALLVEAAQVRARGRRETAARCSAEAVERYEVLAAEDPHAHRPELAYACSVHGMDLAELGSHTAGLAMFDRAVALYQELAAGDSGRLTGVAAAQTGRGVLLADLERHAAAGAAFAAAAEAYRRLGDRPDVLAGVLTAQAEATAADGHLDQATALLRESCDLRDRLHTADPLDSRLRRDLAATYQRLAHLYEQIGDTEAAQSAGLRARLLSSDG